MPHDSHSHHDHAHHGHGHAHSHAHAHDHHASAGASTERRLKLALAVTGLFMLAEVAGGLWSHSLALLADAGHMLTDAASLALALFAVRLSRRPVDAQRSYGYGRMQVLAAFVNGLSLVGIAVWIVIEALLRLWQPVPVLAQPMLVIAALGLVANLGAFWALHGGDRENLNLQGALAHVIGDLLGSVAAIAAALIILATGWTPADPLLSIVVAGLILRTGQRITRESGHILLQGAPELVDLDELEARLRAAVPGLASIHHVHLWSMTPGERIMTLHAVLDAAADGDAVTAAIGRYLRESKGIGHITVQVERQPCADPVHGCNH